MLVLAVPMRAGLRVFTTPVGYVVGGAAGGALLYVIMMEAVGRSLNHHHRRLHARAPFFLAHLLYGAVVGGYLYWRASATAQPARDRVARLRTRAA